MAQRVRVDELVASIKIGAWRGHEIVYRPKENRFRCDSAGVRDAKTLNEVKRVIDEQEKVEYEPINALRVSSYSTRVAEEVTLVRPDVDMGKPAAWVIGPGRERRKVRLDELILDTPANRKLIAAAGEKRSQGNRLHEESRSIIDSIERITGMQRKDEA